MALYMLAPYNVVPRKYTCTFLNYTCVGFCRPVKSLKSPIVKRVSLEKKMSKLHKQE